MISGGKRPGVPGLYKESLHGHLPHTEQEVEIIAGEKKKILTSSYPEGCRSAMHPLSHLCADT